MAQIANDFETGTNGNNIATSDAGSPTQWDVVNIGSGGTVKYDNANVAHGTLAAKIQGGAASQSWLQWDYGSHWTQPTDHYGRFGFYFTGAPVSATSILSMLSTAGANAMSIRLNSSRQLELADKDVSIWATSAALSINTQYRIEYHFVHSTTVGSSECKIFAGDSSTPLETIAFTGKNTQATSGYYLLGTYAYNNQGPFWYDDVIAQAVAYPGPAVVAASSAAMSLRRTPRRRAIERI